MTLHIVFNSPSELTWEAIRADGTAEVVLLQGESADAVPGTISRETDPLSGDGLDRLLGAVLRAERVSCW